MGLFNSPTSYSANSALWHTFPDSSKSPKDKRKKLKDDYEDEDDRRDRYERRRPSTRRHDKSHKKGDKRILDDEYEYEDDIRPPRRNQKEVRDADRRRPYEKGDETRTNSRLGVRRPPSEDFEDDLQRADNSRLHDKRRQNKETSFIKPLDDGRPIVKPVSGTIYDRPRVAPRINLPVPKNAAEKYAYKSLTGKAPPTQSTPPSKVEEDEEEYDDEPPTKRSKLEKKNSSPGSTQQTNTKSKEAEKTESIPQTNPKPQSEEVYVEEPSIKQLKLEKRIQVLILPNQLTSSIKKQERSKLLSTSAPGNSTSAPAISEEYDDYYDDVSPKMAVEKDSKTDSTATSTTKSKIEALADQPMPIIRKFKRPFLPSRGGNPFSARSLQPVGSKTSSRNETQRYKGAKNMEATASPDVTRREEIQEVTPDSRPIPMRVKSPMFAKSTTSTPAEVASSPITEEIKQSQLESEAKPGPIRIKVPIRVVPPVTEPKLKFKSYSNGHGGYPLIDATTTERTKLSQSDILNGNYDVTLNEAISPIIPKIPVRNYGGFNPTNDYTYKRIQRPTKFVILDPVVSDGPFYVK
ncbi:hypothetical protein NQ318_001129 [Aromia moschata]|uniref:Uncharacterized protein n=1 Tax=Aromia moschata TaxID=1265417 RepID=A0AAV8ZG95_9CUCU|nr:hypothetical protein NQ318_001129 [Aromia moschata]